jgi:hypothetical protein
LTLFIITNSGTQHMDWTLQARNISEESHQSADLQERRFRDLGVRPKSRAVTHFQKLCNSLSGDDLTYATCVVLALLSQLHEHFPQQAYIRDTSCKQTRAVATSVIVTTTDVTGSTLSTRIYHHTHIYIASLLHRFSINSVFHFHRH